MSNIVKKFSDGSFVEYDKGSFDNWCVYYTIGENNRFAPTDVQCFDKLLKLANIYSADTVYNDYVKVYNWTGTQLDKTVLDSITTLSKSYGEHASDADIVFSILYMAMIAEENKAYTKLGKRIKRISIYKLLKEGKSVETAANFTRGMKWQNIDAMCQKLGF